ncbi:MAG: YigZ family protein [bacterium]|nr:YigZ family protein [bacterium]
MPEPESFRTPACEFRYEPEKVKGSRFIADVAPVQSGEAAEAFVQRIREEFPDACHHCYAWRTGMEGKNNRANDDGEPGGSAGRPILAQLEGHEVTQLVVAVTRYFGGTKLGVGGLMRAYGSAAGQALDRAEIETKIITQAVAFAYPYDCSGPVESVLHGHELSLEDPEYGEEVSGRVLVPRNQVHAFKAELVERTAGRLRFLDD